MNEQESMRCPVCNYSELPVPRIGKDEKCPRCQSYIRREPNQIFPLDDGKKPLGLRRLELEARLA